MTPQAARALNLARIAAEEDAVERYHAGYGARLDGEPRPITCPDAAAGWDEADRVRRVRAVMPVRPEGYYHAPPGAFD